MFGPSPALARFSIHQLWSDTHRIEHCSLSREPICAYALAVKLKRSVHVAVPEQPLNHFWVCADTDEEGCQRVPQVVEAKPALIVSRENSDPDCCWSDMVLNQNAGTSRLLALYPGTGETQSPGCEYGVV